MVQLDCIFSHLSVMGQICSNQHKISYNNDYRTELYIMKYQYFRFKLKDFYKLIKYVFTCITRKMITHWCHIISFKDVPYLK